MKTVAIVTKSIALATAIEATLAPKMKGARFVVVQKISDAPVGAELATLGLPAFIPGTSSTKVHSVGTRILPQGSTTAQRSAQWDILRSDSSTPEQIIAELGYSDEYLVLPGKAYAEAKNVIGEASLAISEAEDDDELIAAYKSAFKSLRGILSPAAAMAVVEEPLGEDEAPL